MGVQLWYLHGGKELSASSIVFSTLDRVSSFNNCRIMPTILPPVFVLDTQDMGYQFLFS